MVLQYRIEISLNSITRSTVRHLVRRVTPDVVIVDEISAVILLKALVYVRVVVRSLALPALAGPARPGPVLLPAVPAAFVPGTLF